jgi:hypothetical protein
MRKIETTPIADIIRIFDDAAEALDEAQSAIESNAEAFEAKLEEAIGKLSALDLFWRTDADLNQQREIIEAVAMIRKVIDMRYKS